MTMLIDICNGPRYISDRLRVHIARCRLLAFRFSARAAPLRQLRCGGKRSVAAAAPIVSERRSASRGVAGLAQRIAHMQRRLRSALCMCRCALAFARELDDSERKLAFNNDRSLGRQAAARFLRSCVRGAAARTMRLLSCSNCRRGELRPARSVAWRCQRALAQTWIVTRC